MHLSGLLLLVSLLVLANAGLTLAKKSKDTVKKQRTYFLLNDYFLILRKRAFGPMKKETNSLARLTGTDRK